MSVHAISWVLRNSDERLGNRLVLIALADHAGADGTNSFASVETLGSEARMSERAVRYALRNLEQSGSIRAKGKHSSGTTVYDLPGVQYLPPPVQNPVRGVSDSAPEPSTNRQRSSGADFAGCPKCGISPPGTTTLEEHLENVHGVRAA